MKLGTIFAILLDRDSLECDSFLRPSEPGWENCSPQQLSTEERNEILHHHFLFMTTVTRENRKIRGWELLIFNCCLPKSQWFYTEWFVINSYDSYCSTVVWKSIDLESNCFKTHAHYVKRVNIYSIIAGSFNTRILYWVKIEQNILIDDETLGYFRHPKRWFSDNGQYRKKLGLSEKNL